MSSLAEGIERTHIVFRRCRSRYGAAHLQMCTSPVPADLDKIGQKQNALIRLRKCILVSVQFAYISKVFSMSMPAGDIQRTRSAPWWMLIVSVMR